MTDIDKVIDLITKLTKNCDVLDRLNENADKQFKKSESEINNSRDSLIADMRNNFDKYKRKTFDSVKSDIVHLIRIFSDIYQEEWDNCQSAQNLHGKTFAEIKQIYEESIKQINIYISELNAFDFNTLINNDEDDLSIELLPSHPLKSILEELFPHCKDALACINAMSIMYERNFTLDNYSSSVKSNAHALLAEIRATGRASVDKKREELFGNTSVNDRFNKFLDTLYADGNAVELDPSIASSDYGEFLNIGDIAFNVADKQRVEYIEGSSALAHYFKKDPFGGKSIKMPVIMDLKKCGNILLTVDEDNYDEDTDRFIKQIILQFLLTFPANRIKFNLIDIGNKGGLSPLKSLTKIDSEILTGGIVRDDRKFDDAIKDIEQNMYCVEDDKLSFNGVNDIFEYNAKFKATPQNVYLMVLIDSPSSMRSDTAKRVAKIVQNGNKCGIYTLIVHSKSAVVDSMLGFEDYQAYVNALAGNSLVIDKTDGVFRFVSSPTNKLGASISCSRKETDRYRHGTYIDFGPTTAYFYPVEQDKLSVSMLPQIVETLSDASEIGKQTVVDIRDMFAYSDERESNGKAKPLPEDVLEIPVGVCGGETQTVCFRTSGGSAHAVVIGGTGSGKSNLLHTIILNTCYGYSPNDVNFYLIDFKGGVEFKFYETNQLPHIKLTSLTSDLNDGVAVLMNLQKELRAREDTFRNSGVEDIIHFRKLGHNMPRILVLIDEIQELFERDDVLGQKAIDILSEMVKKGRAFGINILWASQNVPRVPGLKNKVLSQIGNKICLKLNDHENALDLDLDINAVKRLNRPEKGLGVINDERYGREAREFRVAYAESSENRKKFVSQIVDKWRRVTDKTEQTPLFVVGNDVPPSPIEKDTLFGFVPNKTDITPRAFSSYRIEIGRDYITGKPFVVDLNKGDRENVLILGNDVEITRDIMGYSLLSVVCNAATDSDFLSQCGAAFYANGEMLNPQNSADLFNVVKTDFADIVENVSSTGKLVQAVADLYGLYQTRIDDAENCEELKTFSPYYVVIHNFQRYVDTFNANSPLPSDGVAIDGSGDIVQNKATGIADAFKAMYLKGGKVGIHFIISVDNPNSFMSLKKELLDCSHIIVTKGVNKDLGIAVFGDTRTMGGLSNPQVAIVQNNDEQTKIKPYRYDIGKDDAWYSKLCADYKNILKDGNL